MHACVAVFFCSNLAGVNKLSFSMSGEGFENNVQLSAIRGDSKYINVQ